MKILFVSLHSESYLLYAAEAYSGVEVCDARNDEGGYAAGKQPISFVKLVFVNKPRICFCSQPVGRIGLLLVKH